jgi:hypothetical protein
MTLPFGSSIFRIVSLHLIVGALVVLSGCPAAPPSSDDDRPDEQVSGGADGTSDDGGGMDGSSDEGNGADGELFSELSGTELLVEGTSFDESDGGFRRREERFSSTFSLVRLDAEHCSDVFVGDLLLPVTCGNLGGQAHLTYSESGMDFR